MRFSKWHALGNDYLLLARAEVGRALDPATVRRLCDVHTGIGADGVLEVLEVSGASADLRIWNPDGSTAELSGNGTRIAARWLARLAGAEQVRVAVSGREITAWLRGGLLVEQDMGEVTVGGLEELDLDGEPIPFTPVSIGNPHAVVRREPNRSALLELGPAIERHRRFPGRTNVQLVRVDSPHEVTAVVWERGAGETRSSGTSACAVAAAAVANGWCSSPVGVRMPGGELVVAIESGRARLTGPAQEICRGELSEELLAELG